MICSFRFWIYSFFSTTSCSAFCWHSLQILSISLSILFQVCSEQGFLTYSTSGKPILPILDMPNLVTRQVMIFLARFRSSSPLLVTYPLKIFSEVRPASEQTILLISSASVFKGISLFISCEYPLPDLEQGMMETLMTGSAPSVNHAATAFPHSQQARHSFSSWENRFLFQRPAITRSVAFSNSGRSISSLLALAARMAASLQMLESSAPLKPGVSTLIFLPSSQRVNLLLNFTFCRCTFSISMRSSKLGRPISTDLSNLPGLSRAGSRESLILVAAITMILCLVSKPSMLTSSWFSVFSFYSLAKGPEFLFFPIASIQSMKMMLGAAFAAESNRLRTRLAPIPTYFSTNSLPDTQKKGTPASPAHALASRVLPVPGGPVSRAPLGILAPISMYLSGFFKKSTNSVISSLASCIPATSLKQVLMFSGLMGSNFLVFMRLSSPLDPKLNDPVLYLQKIQPSSPKKRMLPMLMLFLAGTDSAEQLKETRQGWLIFSRLVRNAGRLVMTQVTGQSVLLSSFATQMFWQMGWLPEYTASRTIIISGLQFPEDSSPSICDSLTIRLALVAIDSCDCVFSPKKKSRAAMVMATSPRLPCNLACFSAQDCSSSPLWGGKRRKGLAVLAVLQLSAILLPYFISLRHYWMSVFYRPVDILGLRAWLQLFFGYLSSQENRQQKWVVKVFLGSQAVSFLNIG